MEKWMEKDVYTLKTEIYLRAILNRVGFQG